MGSREPDPLCPHVVHVREDGCNGAQITYPLGSVCPSRAQGKLRLPRPGVKVLDQNLVHAIVGRKDPRGGMAEVERSELPRPVHRFCSSTHWTESLRLDFLP